MGGGPQGPPHDHPGEYRIISVTQSPATIKLDFDKAEADGFEFKDLNDSVAVFYRDNGHH